MKTSIRQRVCAAIVIAFSAGIVFGAPAYADPASGTTTTVEMPMPGTGQPADGGASYQPPAVSMSVQGGAGGVDRDGTSGSIDPDGTNGSITGPLMRATPGVHAAPPPPSPRTRS